MARVPWKDGIQFELSMTWVLRLEKAQHGSHSHGSVHLRRELGTKRAYHGTVGVRAFPIDRTDVNSASMPPGAAQAEIRYY